MTESIEADPITPSDQAERRSLVAVLDALPASLHASCADIRAALLSGAPRAALITALAPLAEEVSSTAVPPFVAAVCRLHLGHIADLDPLREHMYNAARAGQIAHLDCRAMFALDALAPEVAADVLAGVVERVNSRRISVECAAPILEQVARVLDSGRRADGRWVELAHEILVHSMAVPPDISDAAWRILAEGSHPERVVRIVSLQSSIGSLPPRILTSLGRTRDPAAMPPLTEALDSEESATRAAAAQGVLEAGMGMTGRRLSLRAIDVLETMLRDRRDLDGQLSAARVLATVDRLEANLLRDSARPMLERFRAMEKDPGHRERLTQAIALLTGTEAGTS